MKSPRPRISVQSAKAKGRQLQQEVRDALLEAFPSLEPDDIRSTSMGAGGEDLMLSPAARKLLGGIQIECKRLKTLKTLYGWLTQAKAHGPYKPVVFVRADREEAVAILPMKDYIELVKGKT
jgi:hypothetical protein